MLKDDVIEEESNFNKPITSQQKAISCMIIKLI